MEHYLRIAFVILTFIGLVFTLYYINNIETLSGLNITATLLSASKFRGESNLFRYEKLCRLTVENVVVQEILKTDYVFMMPRPKEIIYRNKSMLTSSGKDSQRIIVFSPQIIVETSCAYCHDALDYDFNSSWFNVFKQYEQSIAIPVEIFCRNNRAVNLTISGSKSRDIVVNPIASINIIIQKQFEGDLSCVVGKYELLIDVNNVKIVSCSEEGVRHSLSSLSQIVENLQIIELPIAVRDWPKFSWRGMLIDVARHFIPMRQLYRTVDAMAVVKINVLHFHLTDSQSFPVLFDDLPGLPLSRLARNGSFAPNQIYTLFELAAFSSYAKQRGIQVIPEIDVPAHTLSWNRAFPGIVVTCPETMRRRASQGASITDIPALDLTNPLVLDILKGIISQLSAVFDSEFIHIGGDEVRAECWDESENMVSFKKKQGYKSWAPIVKQFETELFAILYAHGKTPIVWQGVHDMKAIPDSTGLRNPAIVMPWMCWSGIAPASAKTAASVGHNVINAACMYLDWNIDWIEILSTDSTETAKTAVELVGRKLVSAPDMNKNHNMQSPKMISHRRLRQEQFLGGIGALWLESIDFSNFECRLWPRAVAVASVLWGFSSKEDNIVKKLRNPIVSKTSRPRFNSSTFPVINYEQTLERMRLLGSYSFVRNYISDRFHVKAATVTAHWDGNVELCEPSTVKSVIQQPLSQNLNPIAISNPIEISSILFSEIRCKQEKGIAPIVPEFSSQCEALPQHLRVPVIKSSFPSYLNVTAEETSAYDESITIKVKCSQLNIANGANSGHSKYPNRLDLLQTWLRSRVEAGDLFIGLCELNSWEKLRSDFVRKDNFPQMIFRASAAGFTYSHVLKSDNNPYSIGIVSVLPFVVVKTYGPPNLLRGLLHVYFEYLDLHVLILHLTPRKSLERRKEAEFIKFIVKKLIDERKRVVLMGDFNTLSSSDHNVLYASDIAPICKNNSLYNGTQMCSDNGMYKGLVQILSQHNSEVYTRLREKYLYKSSIGERQIDYDPFSIILSAGLHEVCEEMCNKTANAETKYMDRRKARDILHYRFIQCMFDNCGSSEPTSYDPEWSLDFIKSPIAPPIRVDYILLANSILREQSPDAKVEGTIFKTNVTSYLSDHYPVHAEFELRCNAVHWRK